MKLFCQIVDESGKLLTRRSLSIRRSSSIPWQASQNLDTGSAKPIAAATGSPVLQAAMCKGFHRHSKPNQACS